jgi:hypothetical protein
MRAYGGCPCAEPRGRSASEPLRIASIVEVIAGTRPGLHIPSTPNRVAEQVRKSGTWGRAVLNYSFQAVIASVVASCFPVPRAGSLEGRSFGPRSQN